MPQIAYLGPPIDHMYSLRSALESAGKKLVYLPDSNTWRQSHPRADASGLASRLARVQAQFFGTKDEAYLSNTLQAIDEQEVEWVVACWGTLPLPDVRTLKQRRPHVKFVLNLLCHPLALDRPRVLLQHLLLSRATDSLSGLMASSHFMEQYLRRHVRGMDRLQVLCQPPAWTQAYAPSAPLPALAERANVVFLGRMDWQRGQPSDNVSQSLKELMDNGIDVFYSRSAGSELDHPHSRPFDAVPLRAAADFAAPFDASLIQYNVASAPVKDRFAVTVPDRLITSVCAGIPIALPRQGFDACEEYLRPYRAVLRFGSIQELAEQLRDRESIAAMRMMAREDCKGYRAELQLPEWIDFLERLQ